MESYTILTLLTISRNCYWIGKEKCDTRTSSLKRHWSLYTMILPNRALLLVSSFRGTLGTRMVAHESGSSTTSFWICWSLMLKLVRKSSTTWWTPQYKICLMEMLFVYIMWMKVDQVQLQGIYRKKLIRKHIFDQMKVDQVRPRGIPWK
jgi:hypothetical protein